MIIRDRKTSQVFFEHEWRRWILANNGPNFDQITPAILELLEADPVLEGAYPQLDRYQTADVQGVIQKSDGNWYTNWVAVDVTEEARQQIDQAQADSVRATRNKRLLDSDWIVLKSLENGQAVSNNWKQYRQTLRDLPNQSGFPWDVEWPIAPAD